MAARLIYGDEPRLLPWAAERIGIASFRRDAYTIGLERDGVLAAVAVYDNFSEGDCNVHLASDGSKRWMSKEFLLAG
ncbi:MAG TPA: N-acetyltransferase, partial [Burkholderiaceae bacterium]|nr:N-acetyltransferase [Burkholderiaceae bacterium]